MASLTPMARERALARQEVRERGRVVRSIVDASTYVGRSTQYSCGGFSEMRFDVVALEPAAFDDWVRQTKAAGGALDAVAYTRLVRPSSAVPPATFGVVAPKLFETAIHLTVR